MDFTQLSDEYSTVITDPTASLIFEPCYQFPSIYFQTGSSTVPYIVNASLNVLLALVTTAANTLLLSALQKNTSLRLPSKLLLANLVVTDLGAGLAVQPMFVAFLVAKVKGSSGIICPVYVIFTTVGSTLACVSLLTMTAISLDRYIALYFHLRYRDIVTTKRVFLVLVAIWLFAGFFGFLWLWNQSSYSYFVVAGTSIAFIVTTFAYIMIYRGLRHQHVNQATNQAQVQTKQKSANTLNVARYRRSASNMLWIYIVFVLCYLPYVLTRIVTRIVGRTILVQCLLEFAATVMALNSCLNPFVYCYRLPEIRASVLETLHKIWGESPQQWIQVSRDN